MVHCDLAELSVMFHSGPVLTVSLLHFHLTTPGSPQHKNVVNLDWVPKGQLTTYHKESFKMLDFLKSGS